ncbi:MAG: hypothetical protein NVSMB4_01170 [Acidimicrobiales bacterium]
MSDEECPHGLEREWCSLCRAAAAGARPAGVKARPAPKVRAVRSGGGSPRAATPRSVAPPLGPVAALARARKVIFHATSYGSWESIAESGLRTAEQILEAPAVRFREDDVVRPAPAGGTYRVRDQRLMARARVQDHLDGIDLPQWLALLHQRAFFFVAQRDLITHLGRYQQSVGQDVLVFDTARLARAAAGRIEVTTVYPSAPDTFGFCPCRGRDTFVPLGAFQAQAAEVVEVTVVGGLESVDGLVDRVVRYHPGGTSEVLVG